MATKGKTNNPKGRPKGKPNKVTGGLRLWIDELISTNREKLERDLKEMEPRDRWQVVERLMQYVIPKQQSIDLTTQLQAEYSQLEKLLNSAPDEAIKEIVIKIEALRNLSSKEDGQA